MSLVDRMWGRVRGRLQWRIAALKNGFQDATAYRIEFIFEIAGSAFVPVAIQWLLWYAMFKLSGATRVAGMTYTDVLHYTLATMLFSQIRGGDHDFELAEMIRSGALSNYLLRPVSVVEFVYLRGVAPRLFIAGLCLSIGLVSSVFVGISPWHMVGAMLMAFIGNIIHYQIGSALATAAFLWEESYSILMVKNMVVQILSGELIPLNMFPHSLQWIWKSTPFYLYVYGPAQFAMGRWTDVQYMQSMLIACAWLVIGWILVRTTWMLGIRRYLSLGG